MISLLLVSGVASAANKMSLVTEAELSGAAVPSPRATFVSPSKYSINTAMLTAVETEAQLRRVELYLKSGPAQNGDLRVVETGKPDQVKK